MTDLEQVALYVHDVKNQLAWMAGRAEAGGDREMQRTAMQAAGKLASLLLLLRRQAGGLAVQADAVCVPDLLEELAADYRHLYDQQLDLDLAGAPELWFLDRGLVSMALRNLLDNAGRYGQPPLRLSARTEADELLIEVADHGSGFPAAGTAPAGTGLGLELVRAVCEAHENAGRTGRLECVNDHGAVARLALPR